MIHIAIECVCVFVVWIVTSFLLFDIYWIQRRGHKIQSQSGNTTIDSREYQFMLRCKCNVERERNGERKKMRVYSMRCKQTANRREKTDDDDGRRKRRTRRNI